MTSFNFGRWLEKILSWASDRSQNCFGEAGGVGTEAEDSDRTVWLVTPASLLMRSAVA